MKKGKYYGVIILIAFGVAGFGFFARAQVVGPTLPSVPTAVTATVVPPSQISIAWTAATESSGTIEGYYVYRNGVQIAATADTSLVDPGLASGVYVYTVAAYDMSGNVSARSSPASVTLVIDTTPPSVPTGLTVSGTTSTNSVYVQAPITISWSASTDNVGIAGYYVYRNGIKITTSTTAFTSTSITDAVVPGTYTYTVAAYDAAQNVSDRSVPLTVTVLVNNTPPSIPTNVSVQQVSATGVNVAWTASTDSIGIAGYQVYRNGVQVASAAGSPYADSGLSAGTNYLYAVAAYDAAGNFSQLSSAVQMRVQSISGPSVPDVYSATLLGTSTVRISWVSSWDVLPITGYFIYRNGTQIASVTSTNYLDGGLASGTYAYGVSATDVTGAVSALSAAVSVIVPAFQSGIAPLAATPVVVSSPSGTVSAPAGTNGSMSFTQNLYFGLRNAQVSALQSLLAGYGYLASAATTGFFGNLTLRAVEKFQCDQNIVCTGGAGWGTVGPKTRNILNNLQEGNSTPTASSTSALNAEIQALQAELANLEQQLSAASH